MLDTNKITPAVKLAIVRQMTGKLVDEPYSGFADSDLARLSVQEAFAYWCAARGVEENLPELVNVLDMMRNAETGERVPTRGHSSDLETIRKTWSFTWGQIVRFYDAGPYTVVEYHPWATTENGHGLRGEPSDKLEYYCYVNGKNTHYSAPSFDEGLAYCIAYNAEGPGSMAARYFIKMLGKRG